MRDGLAMLCCALLVSLESAPAPAHANGFGDGVDVHRANPRSLQLDLDGDGRADRVDLVRVAAGANVRRDVRVANPWRRAPLPPRGASLALAITLSSAGRHLVSDGEFFASPIWRAAALPLAAVRRGSAEYAEFATLVRDARGDLLRLGTEAGIDIALYWTGREFRLAWPDERP